MGFVIDLGAGLGAGLGASAGLAEGQRADMQFAAQQRQQAFQQQLALRQQQQQENLNNRNQKLREWQAQQDQQVEAQKQRDLQKHRQQTNDLGYDRLQAQFDISANNNQNRTDIANSANQNRVNLMQLNNQAKAQVVQDNLAWAKTKEANRSDQFSTKVGQLKAWRQASLNQGGNRLAVEQQYHQALLNMRQDEVNAKKAAGAGFTDTTPIGGFGSGGGVMPTTQPAQAIPTPAQAPQLPAVPRSPVLPPPNGQAAPNSAQAIIQASPGTTPETKAINAADALTKAGYQTFPDGTPVQAVKQKAQKFLSVRMTIDDRKELTNQQLIDLVQSVGDKNQAKAYLSSRGYDEYGRPIKGN